MKKLFTIFACLFLFTSFGLAQNSAVFYNGDDTPEGLAVWPWGFLTDAIAIDDAGYAPGTKAMRWITADTGSETQGIFFYYESYVGVDFSSQWDSDSVYFKLRAPQGIEDDDTLKVWLYDPTNTDVWDYAVFYDLAPAAILADGEYHQFAIALKDFQVYVNDIDRTNIIAVSLETAGNLISAEMHIDDVWIGHPTVPATMTIFNGQAVPPGVSTEFWGFENNDLVFAEGEGYTAGTNAILWETSNWDWQGKGFYFAPQNMSTGWATDSLKIKIKAPAGINDFVLVWYDWSDNKASFTLDSNFVTWDGQWKALEIPLADFTLDDGFDASTVYYFSIEAAGATIPERVLLDEIWVANPPIENDFIPPAPPENVFADVSTPYVNLIAWADNADEAGETYDVYASLNPITDLEASGVIDLKKGVPENEVVSHNIYYPLTEGVISYYYAVTCTDKAGNKSESFTTMDTPVTNTGKKRAIISLDPPQNFVADGNLQEWQHIEPFSLNPDRNLFTGEIADSLDYSALCYVAFDNEFLYVAFDVFDDVYSYKPENTVDWWDDEAIEFFFGLYQRGNHHLFFYEGEEPDYRLVFKPYHVELPDESYIESGTDSYLFEPLGESDYIIEARIPLAAIQADGDTPFVPVQGMTIPFEIFAADADVPDGGNESRLQLGDSPALNPYHGGPQFWTFAWVGVPDLTAVEMDKADVISSYRLRDNYPNPFNPSTKINYEIPENSHVKLHVYNALGQYITTLVDSKQTKGAYEVTFDATNLASGLYFYKLETTDFVQVKKMLLIK